MTGFAATHTGSLTPSSNPWTFVGTVTWQSDIDAALLPDNQPVVLRLAFTTLDLTGATIAFTTSGSGRAATLPADGPFTDATDYTVASHKDRTVTYTITGTVASGSGAIAMRARSENFDLFTNTGAAESFTLPADGRVDIGGGTGGTSSPGIGHLGFGGRVEGSLDAGSFSVEVGGQGASSGAAETSAAGGWPDGGGNGGPGGAGGAKGLVVSIEFEKAAI